MTRSLSVTATKSIPADGGPKVVALGGGHGLAAVLTALRRISSRITAVVTVADDGGSSGRIRRELAAVPPGDLRRALSALAADDDIGQLWARLLEHRFDGNGSLAGHAVGNLLITGFAEILDDTAAALDLVARAANVTGRVLPMSPIPLDIVADVAGLTGGVTRIRGQAAVATTKGRVLSVALTPENPPACPDALKAIHEADVVILGPGSWFTSVLPHVLIPDLHKALVTTRARRILTLNLAPEQGETRDYSPEQHLEVLHDYAKGLHFDAVVADVNGVTDESALMSAVSLFGASLVLAPVADDDGSPRHDPVKLAAVFDDILVAHSAWPMVGGRPHGEEPTWR